MADSQSTPKGFDQEQAAAICEGANDAWREMQKEAVAAADARAQTTVPRALRWDRETGSAYTTLTKLQRAELLGMINRDEPIPESIYLDHNGEPQLKPGRRDIADIQTTDRCIACRGPINHLQIGTLMGGELIHSDPRCHSLADLLRACNGVLADAKASLDYADQVLVSREIIGEMRKALQEYV